MKAAKKGPLPSIERLDGVASIPPDPMPALHARQIKRVDPQGMRTRLVAKTRKGARPGDVLVVQHRRAAEPFAGVIVAIRRNGIDTAVLLRNQLAKTGVEMWFKVYNRNVAGMEIVKRRARRARRAKLTYLRQPKHDMGSVNDLVFEWKRTRGRKMMAAAQAARMGKKVDKAAKKGRKEKKEARKA